MTNNPVRESFEKYFANRPISHCVDYLTLISWLDSFSSFDLVKKELELRSCPFCGQQVTVSVLGVSRRLVECLNCHVRTDGYLTRTEAIAAWNKRAGE